MVLSDAAMRQNFECLPWLASWKAGFLTGFDGGESAKNSVFLLRRAGLEKDGTSIAVWQTE